MKISFSKYQGTGNDFVVIDARQLPVSLQPIEINRLCNRHFGVGADGVIIIKDHAEADFEMLYFNADGKPGTMCGNGGRCAVQFVLDNGLKQKKYLFIASDGPHEAVVQDNGWVSIKMQDVNNYTHEMDGTVVNTGSPHLVVQVGNMEKVDVYEEGKALRYSPRFEKEGINVNFVEQRHQHLFVRTYERGVENETLSCGTGVTASAIVFAKHAGFNHFEIRTLGGELTVEYQKVNETEFRDIWLCGPATFVFKGEIVI